MYRPIIAAMLSLGCVLSAPALAHHSFAMYDERRTIELAGAVKSWQWTNPHTELYLIVAQEDGRRLTTPTQWRIEGQSPQVMRSVLMVQRSIFKVGDMVVVKVHPLRDGSNGGSFVSASLSDGRTVRLQPPGA